MQLINEISNFLTMILIIIIMLGFALCGFAFYYLKIKKRNRTKEDMTDYSSFNRRDTKDYIKIDDIKDNMIIMDGKTRFVGAITCRGFDFYSAHETEQAATVQNYFGFINTINKPITYRQYCEAVDLEYTYNMYHEAYEKLLENLFMCTEDLNDAEKEISVNKDKLSEADMQLYQDHINSLKRKINSLEFRKYHMEDQMNYIINISGDKVSPNINETYVFDWVYDPLQFSVELSEDEIYERAKSELHSIAQSKIHALSRCRVKATRCTTVELIEMCRRYSSPISADRYKISDILNSSYFADIVTSTSPDEIIKEGLDIAREESLHMLEDDFDNLFTQAVAFQQSNINDLSKDHLNNDKIEETLES